LRGKTNQIGDPPGGSIRGSSRARSFLGVTLGCRGELGEAKQHEDRDRRSDRCSSDRRGVTSAVPIPDDGMQHRLRTANTDPEVAHCVRDKMCNKLLARAGGNTAHHLRAGIVNSIAAQIRGICGGTAGGAISSAIDQRYFAFDKASPCTHSAWLLQ
jgi:hypothetical protein